jgi:hypothetical protein
MRMFIGHKLKVIADNFPGPVEGVLVDERPDRILLKGADGGITRIIKTHISGFKPQDFEPSDYVPFHVLYCEDKNRGCPGVKYVKEGQGVSMNDYKPFMDPCPCKSETCGFGTKGELRTVSGKVLIEMLNGTMYGDYPTEMKEVEGGNNKTGGKAGGKVGKRQGPRTDSAPEPSEGEG